MTALFVTVAAHLVDTIADFESFLFLHNLSERKLTDVYNANGEAQLQVRE